MGGRAGYRDDVRARYLARIPLPDQDHGPRCLTIPSFQLELPKSGIDPWHAGDQHGLVLDFLVEQWILSLRRERRFGAKRIRAELRRLHDVHLSAVVIHKVLVRHELSVLPRRKRARQQPKRYSRPVPGDRVQMDV